MRQVCDGGLRLRTIYLLTLLSPDVDAEFEQFTVDAGCAPGGVFTAHPADKVANCKGSEGLPAWPAFVSRKDLRMTSHTRAMRTIPLWSMVAAVLWFAGTAHAQDLRGEALVKALQKGGYVLVIRHASSPREVPDKQTANADNNKPERQLDEAGRKSAVAMAKHSAI